MTSKVNAIFLLHITQFFDVARLKNFLISSCPIIEISATGEISHPEDSSRSSGYPERCCDDRLSNGTSTSRRDSQGI